MAKPKRPRDPNQRAKLIVEIGAGEVEEAKRPKDPSYATLRDTIIAVHGPDDDAFIRYWSDVYDGRAWRAFPAFWRTLQERQPGGTVREVVASWSPEDSRLFTTAFFGLDRLPQTETRDCP